MSRKRGPERNKYTSVRLSDEEKEKLKMLCQEYECSQQCLLRVLILREVWRLESFGKSKIPGTLDCKNFELIEKYCSFIGAVFGISSWFYEQVVPSTFTVKKGKWALEELKDIYPIGASVIKARFGLDGNTGMTLREVGLELGVTKARVRQIQAKAFRILRHPRLRKGLEETLIEESFFKS